MEREEVYNAEPFQKRAGPDVGVEAEEKPCCGHCRRPYESSHWVTGVESAGMGTWWSRRTCTPPYALIGRSVDLRGPLDQVVDGTGADQPRPGPGRWCQ